MQSVSSNAVANAISPLQPVDSIIYGNMHPITSNAIERAKFSFINSNTLSSAGWYKIAELGYRNYGFSLSIDLWSNYNNIPSGSHKIQINYGWQSARVIDIAKDSNSVFDKVQICYNSNNTDTMAIYVHYNISKANGLHFNINGGTNRITTFSFVVDNTAWQNTLTYNLGTDGIYDNGTKLT